MQFIDLKTQYKKLEPDIQNAIHQVLNHGQYIMGPEIIELENQLSQFTGSAYCLSCSSGTDALLISLMAQGISKGDKIITTPFTFIATAEAIKLVGATPIFVDIDPRTFNIDCDKIKPHLSRPDVKGIIPVNLFGLCADYDRLYDMTENLDIFILEDAAQSLGAIYRGRRSGSLGHMSATSFFPAKPLGCYGDGGAIFTNDQKLYDIMKSVRIHGQGANKYDAERMGLNGRLDTIQAAILLKKLNIYQEEIDLRQRIAHLYSKQLRDHVEVPFIPDHHISVWAQYSILLQDNLTRSKVIECLKIQGIPTMIYYQKPLHIQRTFDDLKYRWGDFPISEHISDRILSLPMHPYLNTQDIEKICKTIIEAI